MKLVTSDHGKKKHVVTDVSKNSPISRFKEFEVACGFSHFNPPVEEVSGKGLNDIEDLCNNCKRMIRNNNVQKLY